MTYALLVYDLPSAQETLSDQEEEAVYQEYIALSQSPDISGYRLQPPEATITLRVNDGKTQTEPGTVTASEPALAGLYLLDTDDPDHALETAARIPAARLGGRIEIRQLRGG